MKTERLQALIEAYGADPARWPSAERAGPLDLSAPDTQHLLQQARTLDAALDAALPAIAAPAALRAHILRAVPQPSRPWWQDLWQALGGLRLAGPAFACAFSLGLGLAWMLPAQSDAAFADHELEDYLAVAWIDPADSEELP